MPFFVGWRYKLQSLLMLKFLSFIAIPMCWADTHHIHKARNVSPYSCSAYQSTRKGKMRAHPWPNWRPKPGTWRIVSEDSFTAHFLIILSFQWSHNPVLIHITSAQTQLYDSENCEGDHLWRKNTLSDLWREL